MVIPLPPPSTSVTSNSISPAPATTFYFFALVPGVISEDQYHSHLWLGARRGAAAWRRFAELA